MCFLLVKGLPRLWPVLHMRVPSLSRLQLGHLDILRGIKDTSVPPSSVSSLPVALAGEVGACTSGSPRKRGVWDEVVLPLGCE